MSAACSRGVLAGLALVVTSQAIAQPLPPPLVPAQNPITEAKRALGKILFWDAQLSSDSTVSCGTCHVPGVGGADPRIAVNPGPDGQTGNADDILGSLGLALSTAGGHYQPDPTYGFGLQVTARAANPFFMGAWARDLFWDGRALDTFTDPETGNVVIPTRGGLESQAVGPIVSSVEMAYLDRTWDDVRNKLAGARPLALATDLPTDIANVLASAPTYPDLFAAAFGDGAINATRIAFALATYQRTLVPDQTPWDRFIAGQQNAMTQQEQRGWNVFRAPGSRCNVCHAPPVFSDQTFRNIGLRPWQEDDGRRSVTGQFNDRGRFKVPSLRNVGIRPTLMHNGRITDPADAINFYLELGGHQQFDDNKDPLINGINMPPGARVDLAAFLDGALTDPRVAAQEFPFDRPTLHTELDDNPMVSGAGENGSGGFVPTMHAHTPPYVGNLDFRVAVTTALGGAEAFLATSIHPPDAAGHLETSHVIGPITLDGTGAGGGFGTIIWPIADDVNLRGNDVYMQWRITDPGAPGGVATSAVAHFEIYENDPTQCSCGQDFDCDQQTAFSDLLLILTTWGDLGGETDLNGDGVVNFGDLIELLGAWGPCS